MHFVQRLIFFGLPSTTTVACWIFGVQRRRDFLWLWLTLLPNNGFFPQMSQICDTVPPKGFYKQNLIIKPVHKRVKHVIKSKGKSS